MRPAGLIAAPFSGSRISIPNLQPWQLPDCGLRHAFADETELASSLGFRDETELRPGRAESQAARLWQGFAKSILTQNLEQRVFWEVVDRPVFEH